MAESGRSAPADRPRLVENGAKYGNISQMLPTVVQVHGHHKSRCKRCFRSVMTKGASTTNLAKHVVDRHADLFREFRELQISDRYPSDGSQASFFFFL